MSANDRAIAMVELLRRTGGLTYDQLKEELKGQMSGAQTFDALAKLTRDGVLNRRATVNGDRIYVLNGAAETYTPRPRGSYT